ncbi:hypothetical protein D3C72_2156830 [compost metagenome]
MVCRLKTQIHAAQQGNGQQRGGQAPQQHAQCKHQNTHVVTCISRLVGFVGLRNLQALECAHQRHQHVAFFTAHGQEARHQIAAEVPTFHGAHQLT